MGFITALLSTGFKAIVDLVCFLLSFLPDSPFGKMIEYVHGFDFLPFLNWFIPFDMAFTFMSLWLTAVGGYYIYKYGKQISQVIPYMDKFFG